jgi:threo-3-hydroxy-L-aspartate ammonia-lyase
MTSSVPLAASFADVQAAAVRLAGVAQRTPLFRSRSFDAATGREVVFKAEQLQRTGSFKFRGAYNRLSLLGPNQRRSGVVAFSSGNHAQGVALAAQLLGIPAVIVMPDDAPAVKVAATHAYGAEIVFYDRLRADREALAARLAAERGAVVVPSFNDPLVIAGQGTVALELLEEQPELDALLIPTGGGGLLSGCALAATALRPGIALYGVEPETADDVRQSLHAGQIVQIPPPTTIADGVRLQAPGTLTFPIIRRYVRDVVLVSEAELVAALRFVVLHMKLVIEPTAALGVAAALYGRLPSELRRIGIVLCGGNVEPTQLGWLLTQDP